MSIHRSLSLTLSLALCLIILAAFLAMVGGPIQAQGTTRHVAPGGNCNGAPLCYATIQAAVDAAGNGDLIKVANGVYNQVNNQGGSNQVVYLDRTLTIRGGYAILDWTTADPQANPTILDAEEQGRGILIAGPGITVTLEGLRITGGDATAAGESGGGLHASDATVIVRRSDIYSNTAEAYGGGLYLVQSTFTLEASTVQSNTVLASDYYEGGGAVFASACQTSLNDNIFGHNASGERAGGVYLGGGQASLVGNTFVDNRGLGREGGGVHARNAQVTLTENAFRENQAHWGGGVYADMGTVTLTLNVFFSNTATVYSGGAVAILDGSGRMDHNTFTANRANSRGGGVHLYQSDATFDGNLFADNRVVGDGGGLSALGQSQTLVNNAFVDNQATDQAGGLLLIGTTTTLWHTTLARNGDLAVYVDTGTAHFTNTLVYSHSVGVESDGGNVWMRRTLWEDNPTPTIGGVTEVESQAGNTALAADGYHLTFNSDARDAALELGVTTDVDAGPRGANPDIGADEFTFPRFVPLTYK